MRLTHFPQKSYKYFKTGDSTPDELAWGNMTNEMNNSTIEESFFSQIMLLFISTSCSDTTPPQSRAMVVKLKSLELSLGNLSGLECVKT
jgi:hypothetical protein